MEGIFVDKNDTIKITFAIARNKEGQVIAYENRKALEDAYKGVDENVDSYDKETVEEHHVIFRRPSFGDTVHMGQNIHMSDATSVNFDPWNMRFQRMRYLLKSWTLKDGQGKPVEANVENLSNLHPAIANIIGVQLDAEVGGIF